MSLNYNPPSTRLVPSSFVSDNGEYGVPKPRSESSQFNIPRGAGTLLTGNSYNGNKERSNLINQVLDNPDNYKILLRYKSDILTPDLVNLFVYLVDNQIISYEELFTFLLEFNDITGVACTISKVGKSRKITDFYVNGNNYLMLVRSPDVMIPVLSYFGMDPMSSSKIDNNVPVVDLISYNGKNKYPQITILTDVYDKRITMNQDLMNLAARSGSINYPTDPELQIRMLSYKTYVKDKRYNQLINSMKQIYVDKISQQILNYML